MDCGILRSLYVKANGQILCDDDFGEQILLGTLGYEAEEGPGIDDILDNENYRHIRDSFGRGEPPWPDVCTRCALFRPRQPPGPDLLKSRIIDKIQIESSLACALKCPSCSNLMQLRTRKGPVHFPLTWLRALLRDLSQKRYQVGSIEFCGQGEPLNHPAFPDLLGAIRDVYPHTRIRIITNGNHDFDRKIGGYFVEETIVSIDGARQDTYEKYRINGRFDKAIEFLTRSARSQMPRGGTVIWKYILLRSNDTDSEISEAQRIAATIGVSRLWFVHGHGEMRSERFSYQNALAIPVTYPNVKVESHPSYNRNSLSLNGVGAASLVSGPLSIVWIDTLVAHPNRTLSLSGWAGSVDRRCSDLRLRIGEAPPTRIPLEIARPEIKQVHPVFGNETCGFDVLLPDPRPPEARSIRMQFELGRPGRDRPPFARRAQLLETFKLRQPPSRLTLEVRLT